MRIRIGVWLVALLWVPFQLLEAQRPIVTGCVSDSLTGELLYAATVQLKGRGTGCITDAEGRFSISVPDGPCVLQVSFLGYTAREVQVHSAGRPVHLEIRLVPDGYVLGEVLVKPRREKYRKRGNPAVDFVRNVIAHRQMNNPRAKSYYSYDQYEKMIFAKNEYIPRKRKDGKTGKFDFLAEFVDTLDSGVTILPVSEKEKVQTVYCRLDPKSEKCLVRGYKSSGIDEIFSSDGVRQFLEEVFREVDIFRNDIPLFLQRFVSPLSAIGPSYYKYYLLDTLRVDGHQCADLGFVPHHSETFGFTGHLYVTLDSTYFVRKAVLNVPKDINLNFVSRLSIEQEFDRAPDGTRLITKDDIKVDFKLTEHSKGLYARRLNVYTNHSFASLDDEQIFREKAPVVTAQEARHRTEEFWQAHRPGDTLRRHRNSTEKMMQRLNAIPAYKVTRQVLSTLFSGYIPTHGDPQKSKFEFGPMNSTVNDNPLEGMRLRAGGTTTTAFSRHLFIDGYVAYGTKDGKPKYDALLEYSFSPRKEFRKEFPVHSIRFEYMYDVNKLGQDYMYTSKDNMMLMIRRKKDSFISYVRQAELAYYHEHYNGLAYGVTLRNRREEATPMAGFLKMEEGGTASPVKHYDMTTLELKFRYAHNEKFYQTHNTRIPITYDAWIINASHIMAGKRFLGSDYGYQRSELGVQKRFWFSAFGYADMIVKSGKVWSQVPYPLLILPNANLTYTIQPESYTNMNALEFINDEYLSWDLTYYMNGNLLNRIPVIRQLRWREVFCFRGLWGHLSSRNDPGSGVSGLYRFPDCTRRMGSTPYMEASVGLENILKFLRIDYVWRLTYLGHPGIQRSGVRMTMALSF